jgi:uncharacterized protein YoxC
MEVLNTTLPIILYILGSILLVVLIILGIKMIRTMTKIEEVVEEVDTKVKKLNNFFNIIDFTTDKLSFLSDKLVEKTSSFIINLFKRNKKREENEDEQQ